MAKAHSHSPTRNGSAPASNRGGVAEEEEEETEFLVPGTIFAGLAKYDVKTGKLDTKLTMAEFQTQLNAWNESQGKLRPVITEVISSLGGRGSAQFIVPVVITKLGLPYTKESQNNVRDVINQMIVGGELVKPMKDGKPQRGPNAGIQLPNYKGLEE